MATPPDKKKLKGFKEFDPSKYINTEPTIEEAVMKNTVVVSFGRMNPITVGHEKLIDKVTAEAGRLKADPMVFMSHSQDAKKNPLSYDDKVKFAKKAFGNTIQKSNAKTIIDVAKSLSGKYKNFVMVVGSDRVDEFQNLLSKYNGKEFNFETIKMVSAGERDPDAEGVEGMSASKMRSLAANKNIKDFSKGLPKKLQSSAPDIMAAVRKGMNMTEETVNEDMNEALNRQQRRKRSIAMRKNRFKIRRGKQKSERKTASRDILMKRARKAAINIFKKKFSKNRPYDELSSGEKEVVDKRVEKISKRRIDSIARKLMPVVKQRERDRRASKAAAASGATKNESISEASYKDTKALKRPHQLMDSNNKPKFDARFRMFKKKNVNESVENLAEELADLIEATENFAEAKLPHALDPNKSLKHARIDRGVDKDNDGDVDEFDKQDIPEEITSTEKTDQTPKMLKKNAGELKHTRKGMAYEETELDEISMNALNNYTAAANKDYDKAHAASDYKKSFKRASGLMKASGKKIEKDTASIRKALNKEQVEEAVDKSSDVYKQYLELKTKSIKELRDMIKRIHRVVDVNGYDKQGAISDILRSRHGNKKVAAAMGLSEATFKVDIEGLPAMFIDAGSASQVKKTLRQMLKKPDDMIKGVDRVQPVEVKKHFRLKALGKDEEQMDEATYKVDIEGLPSMFVDAGSEPQVKKSLRQMLKKPDEAIKGVDRVQPAEVKKHFRLKALGKDDEQIDEVLKPSTGMGTWIKDFQHSDAPQFKGKSDKKKREMAIAAKLAAERNEEVDLDESTPYYNKSSFLKRMSSAAKQERLAREKKAKKFAKEETVAEELDVAEGLGKTIKRGMAGWGAFDKDKPADVVKRVKGQDTDTLKKLSNRGSTGKGSPAELQQKAIRRELKKRGVAEEEAQLNEYPEDLKKMKKVDSYKVGDKVMAKAGGRWNNAVITKPKNPQGNYGIHLTKAGINYLASVDQLRLMQEDVAEEAGAGEEGTNKLVKKYKKDTPNCK